MDTIAARVREISARRGALPSERQLADEIGVNRYLLRRALATLRANGEIAPPRPRSRPNASHRRSLLLQNVNPAQVWEVRLALEPEFTRLAALRGTPDEINALAALHAKSRADVFDLEADIAFHASIAAASRNPLAEYVIEVITDMTRDSTFRMGLPPYTSETGHSHHGEILEAIQRRRPLVAANAMRTHLMAIHRWLIGFPDSRSIEPEQGSTAL